MKTPCSEGLAFEYKITFFIGLIKVPFSSKIQHNVAKAPSIFIIFILHSERINLFTKGYQ